MLKLIQAQQAKTPEHNRQGCLLQFRLSQPQGFLTVPLVLDKVFGNVRKEIAAGGLKGRLIDRAVRAKAKVSLGKHDPP